ncbi:MAG: phosphoribosylpyrophosphate synthetase [Ferruginibacter sp.]
MNTCLYQSTAEALQQLKSRGCKFEFEREPARLYCAVLSLRLDAGEFIVDEVYRFKHPFQKNDSLVYAISSSMGIKGTVKDEYGLYSKNMTLEMAKKLLMHLPGEMMFDKVKDSQSKW